MRSGADASAIVSQMKVKTKASRHAPVDGDDQPVDGGDARDRERAADPDGRLDPVDEGDERPGQAPERHPRPDVWAALVRERRPELGDHEPGGHEEQRADEREPHDVCAPPRATAPSVSRTTIAAIRKQTASTRPSSRRSFECSERRRSTSAAVRDMPTRRPGRRDLPALSIRRPGLRSMGIASARAFPRPVQCRPPSRRPPRGPARSSCRVPHAAPHRDGRGPCRGIEAPPVVRDLAQEGRSLVSSVITPRSRPHACGRSRAPPESTGRPAPRRRGRSGRGIPTPSSARRSPAASGRPAR